MVAYVISILNSIWETTLQMAPWLLFGFLAAGILSLVVSPAVVGRFLGRTAGQRAIALAIALGVPLPLCSCGVLPVAAGLKRSGASKGAVAAFLLSTPQTGVDSFFATGSLLGWCFALLRPLVAAVTGYVGGVAIQRLDDEVAAAPTVEGEAQDAPKTFGKRCQAALVYGYGTLLKGVAPALAVGLLLSALILVFVPNHFFEESWLGNDWIAFPVMLLIGMPMYVCSTASIPVALSLMAKGISPGAALIFLIVGPALNGASLAMLLQILGKKCLAVYLCILSVASILAGVLVNALDGAFNVFPDYVQTTAPTCCTSALAASTVGKTLCAVVMLSLLVWHLVIRRLLPRKPAAASVVAPTEQHHRITVKGMRCCHCRGVVKQLLMDYPTLTAVEPAGDDAFDVVGTLPETLDADLRKLGFERAE